MADFNSNFKDIQQQIFFANLTDQEIQELMDILQTKINTKSKLTKEEKVFFQCCREHRSYADYQDLEIAVCPHCVSTETSKNGRRNNRQRYLCKGCNKTFGDTNGTVLFHSKLSINKWIEFIKMTLHGESCRCIAINLGINKETVLHNRYRICAVLNQLISNQDDFKSLTESDEYYYPLSFKDIKDPMFFLSKLGRMPYTHRNRDKKLDYIKKQGFDRDFLEDLKSNTRIVESELMDYVDEEDLKSQEKFSNAINGMDPEKIIQVLNTLNEQQKKKERYQQSASMLSVLCR